MPGDRADRFPKADASGADLTILDLEDAVAPGDKESALAGVVDWARGHERCVVRLNGVGTQWFDREVRALRGTDVGVVLPKAETATDVLRLADAVGGAPVVGLVETPLGVVNAQALAECGGVVRLALGNVDLAAALGVHPASWSALAPARWNLVVGSAVAGLPAPVDGVTTLLEDPAALDRDLAHARELGFGGRLCIHPRQVAATNAAMSPSADELAWARRVLAAPEDGVRAVDGEMVDAPVVARARSVLARAHRPEDRTDS